MISYMSHIWNTYIHNLPREARGPPISFAAPLLPSVSPFLLAIPLSTLPLKHI